MKHNMQILQEAAAKYGPLCVGLDTDPSYVPECISKNYSSAAEAVLAYNKEIIQRVKKTGAACCFKIQIAYYEAMGLEGMGVYAKTLQEVKKAGFTAVSDIKRGDIAATAAAYAKAHFSGDFESDIITVNPYMGFDTLEPFTKWCADTGKGIFVLLRTSNPGMENLEGSGLKEGGILLDKVGGELNRLCEEFDRIFEGEACSPVGAVVGCTQEENAAFLRERYPSLFFLIPGYGAQGGGAKLAATLLKNAGGTVNSSRGILCAWKKSELCTKKLEAGTLSMSDLGDAAEEACLEAKKDLTAAFDSLR